MTFDLPTAFLCTGIGLEMSMLYALSNPRNRVWGDSAWYVRVGYFAGGALMMFRGVDLFGLAAPARQSVVGGHINIEGLIASIAMFYLFGAKVVAAIRDTYPARVWDRIKYIIRLARCKPKGAELATLAMQGMPVVVPGAGFLDGLPPP